MLFEKENQVKTYKGINPRIKMHSLYTTHITKTKISDTVSAQTNISIPHC
jgi:hypothetical protein